MQLSAKITSVNQLQQQAHTRYQLKICVF